MSTTVREMMTKYEQDSGIGKGASETVTDNLGDGVVTVLDDLTEGEQEALKGTTLHRLETFDITTASGTLEYTGPTDMLGRRILYAELKRAAGSFQRLDYIDYGELFRSVPGWDEGNQDGPPRLVSYNPSNGKIVLWPDPSGAYTVTVHHQQFIQKLALPGTFNWFLNNESLDGSTFASGTTWRRTWIDRPRTVSILASAATTSNVVVTGTDWSGAVITETIAMTGTTRKDGSALFATITSIATPTVASTNFYFGLADTFSGSTPDTARVTSMLPDDYAKLVGPSWAVHKFWLRREEMGLANYWLEVALKHRSDFARKGMSVPNRPIHVFGRQRWGLRRAF